MADEESKTPAGLPPLSPLELWTIITLPEASRISSLCVETLESEHGSKIIHLSPKRRGMRRGDALMIGGKKK